MVWHVYHVVKSNVMKIFVSVFHVWFRLVFQNTLKVILQTFESFAFCWDNLVLNSKVRIYAPSIDINLVYIMSRYK